MRKTLTLLLNILLAVGLAAGIWYSATQASVKEVKGLVGSEKEAFFADPQVQATLKKKYRLKVQAVKAGSREMAGADLAGYSFAFPAGVSAAEVLKKRSGAAQTYDAFYTPLAVASWEPVAGLLQRNGLVQQDQGVSWLDMRALLPLMQSGKRWSDLRGADAYPSKRSLLLNTTDVRKSNSAAMYLALVAYLLNSEAVPQVAEAPALAREAMPLFLRQGFQENSSAGPFEDYLALGAGKAPLVVIYEAQFLEQAGHGGLPAGATLLYPRPTIYAKHVLVPLDAAGQTLGHALAEDPQLQQLAAQYGFRTPDAAQFAGAVQASGVKVPASLVDLAQEPSQEVLNAMIAQIEKEYP